MKLQIEHEDNYILDLMGNYIKGSPDHYDSWNDRWTRGDGPRVEDLKVYFRGIDVTSTFGADEIKALKSSFIDAVEELED